MPQKQQKYHIKPKQYCCLYHFSSKQTKGLSPCNNHVSLGIINPITSLTSQQLQIRRKGKNLYDGLALGKVQFQKIKVSAEEFVLNFHTHFHNQIQNKGTINRKFVHPRVYVNKVNNKRYVNRNLNFVHPNNQNKAQFQVILKLFKKFAQKSKILNQTQLKRDILQFAQKNKIKNQSQVRSSQFLFSKQNFKSYLHSHNLSAIQSQQFFQSIHMSNIFLITKRTSTSIQSSSDYISMKAFVYNYKKYYLEEEEYFKNMFSQPGFRQRLIDLRLNLSNFYYHNVQFKQNVRKYQSIELETANYFKVNLQQCKSNLQQYKSNRQLHWYQTILQLIQQRNRIYFLIRTIAKSIFDLTDQKNFGLDVWNDRITYLIQQKTDSLICFMQFIDKFKQQVIRQQLQTQQKRQQLKLTQLVQYLQSKKSQYDQLQTNWLITYIRHIYKYLYHYKQIQQLQLNPITLKLVAKGSISIKMQILQQFIMFKSGQIDREIQVLNQITQQIQNNINDMPELQGKKKYLVQCNYVTETITRFIKRNSLASFTTLSKISHIVQSCWFDFDNCKQDIIQELDKYHTKDQQIRFDNKLLKQLFALPSNEKQNIIQSKSNVQKEAYSYKDAIQKYQNVKSALGIQGSNLTQKNAPIKLTKPANINIKKVTNKSIKFIQSLSKQKEETKQKIQQFDWSLNYKLHQKQYCNQGYCKLCDDLVETEINSTISNVQGMESYLIDLLKNI